MEKEEKTSLNIFGACTSRDILDNRYQVHQYVSFTSPMMMMLEQDKKWDLNQSDISSFNLSGTDFSKRCFFLDHNRMAFEYLTRQESDYLILDIADSRIDILKYGEEYCTLSNIVRKNQKKIAADKDTQLISFRSFSDEQWMECIVRFCNEIKKLYRPEQIILHEFNLVSEYVTKAFEIIPFRVSQGVEMKNDLLQKLYPVMERELEGCHIIKFPENMLGDQANKWGIHPLHYTPLYYEYGLRAIDYIISGQNEPDRKEEKRYLEELRKEYSLKGLIQRKEIELKRQKILNRSQQIKISKLLHYAKSFLYVEQNYLDVICSMKNFLNQNNIHSVALYGDYLTTQMLKDLLLTCKVKIDYVVSDKPSSICSEVLGTGLDSYPKTDAMIICNILTIDLTKKSLQGKITFPVYDYYDFIAAK